MTGGHSGGLIEKQHSPTRRRRVVTQVAQRSQKPKVMNRFFLGTEPRGQLVETPFGVLVRPVVLGSPSAENPGCSRSPRVVSQIPNGQTFKGGRKDNMSSLFTNYADQEVKNQQASGAPPKLSTCGATAAAGIVAVLTLLDPTFNAVFGSTSSPWLKVVVFTIVLFVWGAIMVADTLARKVPSQPLAAPAPSAASANGKSAPDVLGQAYDLLQHAGQEVDQAAELVHGK
jgi:hypothetical protein